MSLAPEPRWWRRRRDLALGAAREAKALAAVALVALDGAQRSAASHLDFIAGVDSGPTGKRLRERWEPVSGGADDAIRAYLDAVSRWDVGEDLEVEDATAAAAAFTASNEAMRHALEEISTWSDRSTEDFVRVTDALQQLVGQRRTTEQALVEVHAEIEAAQAQGLLAPRARELLRQALAGLERAGDPARQGIAQVLRTCQDAAALSAEATTCVRNLPGLRQQVHRHTLSLTTRRSALQHRLEQGDDDVLRTLRRDFVLACSADLDDSAARAAAALGRADQALTEAAEAATDLRQHWELALDALGRAREELNEAQEHLEAPHERLAELRSVAAAPAQAAGRARFAVRDARRLLMAGPVDPRHGQALNALAGRLERAQDLLDRPHPDWLTYAHTLDAIVDGAHGLVVDIRASRAR